MINWKRKLTSRKFWMAVAGLVTGLILAFKGSSETAETVSGCIMAAASVVAYIVGEGLTDQASFLDQAAGKHDPEQTGDAEENDQ